MELATALAVFRLVGKELYGSLVRAESLEEALHLTTTLEVSVQIMLLGRLWTEKKGAPPAS